MLRVLLVVLLFLLFDGIDDGEFILVDGMVMLTGEVFGWGVRVTKAVGTM